MASSTPNPVPGVPGAPGAPAVSAAICYLTQNTEARRVYLKTSLYFLFKHFNAKYRYPVIIFHEGDYDACAQDEIISGIRSSCRDLVSFQALDKEDFQLPPHIDAEKLRRILEVKPAPTPYWRNEKYRMMCRFWLMGWRKYASGFEYIMRLDDDSIIEEPIKQDLFLWMKETGLNYASNLLHTDCGLCNYGMKEFFVRNFPEKKEILEKMFLSQEIPMRSVTMHPFRTVLSLTQSPLPELKDKETVWMPLVFFNNFNMTRTAFWNTPEMNEIFRKIDENGSIFYFRWGDAPLQTILATIFSKPEQISKASFAYSKRLQREAFKGDDGNGMFYSYFPDTYDKSSCITEQRDFMEKLAGQKLT